jgi:hypothetical protein
MSRGSLSRHLTVSAGGAPRPGCHQNDHRDGPAKPASLSSIRRIARFSAWILPCSSMPPLLSASRTITGG